MSRKLVTICFLFVAVTLASQPKTAQYHKGWPSKDGDTNLREGFVNPPKGYGNVPFYWWSGDNLDMDRLTWQLELLADSATDGLCVSYNHSHPRVDTLMNANGYGGYGKVSSGDPYVLSPEWMKLWAEYSKKCAEYWGVRHRFNVSLTGSWKINRLELSLRERWQYTYRPEYTVDQRWSYCYVWNDELQAYEGGWDGEEHTRNAPDLASDNEEDKDQECRNLESGTEESRLDDVTVNKLENQCEYEERNNEMWFCKEQDHCTDKCSDKRTECRCEVAEGNHY